MADLSLKWIYISDSYTTYAKSGRLPCTGLTFCASNPWQNLSPERASGEFAPRASARLVRGREGLRKEGRFRGHNLYTGMAENQLQATRVKYEPKPTTRPAVAVYRRDTTL